MLQNIRDSFTGPIAIAVLGLIAIPFIFVGVSSPNIGSGYAAKVDGQEISLPAFENAWQQQIQQAPELLDYPASILNSARRQILDQMVRETLVNNYIESSGMRAGDTMVTDVIQRDPTFQDGSVFSKQKYLDALAAQGRSPRDYEAQVNQALRQFQLQQAVGATAFVTPYEYRRYLNLYGEQRQVDVATLDFAALQESIEISEQDVVDFYESREGEFVTDETADLEYIEIRRDEVASNAEISAEELQQYYEESGNRYLQDEERQARHILILFGDDETAANEQATALVARVKAGEPFADLAKQYSKDGGTSNIGGDLGLVPQSQMPDALGDAVFSMREGEIRGPVKSDFGFHVVQLDSIVEGGPLPLEQVRAELERELRDRKADTAILGLVTDVSEAIFESLELSAIAEKVGLELKTATEFARTGGAPFGTNQAAINAVFDPNVLTDGQITDIVELDANRSVVLRVAKYHPAEQRPLEDVKEQISGALKLARGQELVSAKQETLRSLIADGQDVATAAAEVGAAAAPTTVVNRSDENLDARLIGEIFQATKPVAGKPTVGTAILSSGNYAVFSVLASVPGRPESIPLAERDARKTQLANQSGGADFAAFINQLENNAEIVTSDAVNLDTDAFE